MERIGGRQVIAEALRSGHKVYKLYYEDRRFLEGDLEKLAEARGLKPEPIPEELKNSVENSQGLLAEIENFAYANLEDVLGRIEGDGLILVLDHLEDPHNLGAIIRTALCGGVDAVVIPDDRSVRVNQTVLKVSAGSAFHLPVIKVKNIAQTLEKLKDRGYWIYGADMDGKARLFETELSGNLCLVMGNEGKGLGQGVRKHCDVLLGIPQVGPLGSLNVSVATGIIVYDVLRQRRSHGDKLL